MTVTQNLVELPLHVIHPDPSNPRRTFDDAELEELAESITAVGLVQPITVRPEGDRYILIAGERRYRAHQLLKRETITVIICGGISTAAASLAQVVENLQRADLNPLEEAHGFASVMDRCGLNQTQLAAKLGVTRTKVAKALGLLRMAPQVQDALGNGAITAGHADVIGTLEHDAQAAAVERITEQGLSVAALRRGLAQAQTSPERATSHTPDPSAIAITATPRSNAVRVLVKVVAQLQTERSSLTTADREVLQQAAHVLAQLGESTC